MFASFDAYPMPCTNILLNQLGEARHVSALDLTKERILAGAPKIEKRLALLHQKAYFNVG